MTSGIAPMGHSSTQSPHARKTSEERLPLYADVADLTIDTAGKNVATIAREVQSALEKEGILCLQRK